MRHGNAIVDEGRPSDDPTLGEVSAELLPLILVSGGNFPGEDALRLLGWLLAGPSAQSVLSVTEDTGQGGRRRLLGAQPGQRLAQLIEIELVEAILVRSSKEEHAVDSFRTDPKPVVRDRVYKKTHRGASA